MNKKKIQEAAKLYVEGKSCVEIADRLGVSGPEVVRYYLRKAGVKLRIPGHRAGHRKTHEPNMDTVEMKRMRKIGKTFREIGEHFCLPGRTIQKRLAWHGIN